PVTQAVTAVGINAGQLAIRDLAFRHQHAKLLRFGTHQPVIGAVAGCGDFGDVGLAIGVNATAIEVAQVIDIAQLGVVDRGAPALAAATGLIETVNPAVFAGVVSAQALLDAVEVARGVIALVITEEGTAEDGVELRRHVTELGVNA